MKTPNMHIMQDFTLQNIPNLDVCVLAALELFQNTKVPKIKIPYKHPLVVGSGNAAATGKIIFSNWDAVFADESNFEQKLKKIKSIDGVVLFSASGAKHAPIIAKKAIKKYKKHVTLITNTKNSMANQFTDGTYIFPKNREPYTYNTSTYMGPILGYTREDPKKIFRFIKERINKRKLPKFKQYKRYYLIVPDEFDGIIRLLNVKFIELFGRQLARDVETFEYMKHATTVVPSKNELFIDFSKDKRRNTEYGEKQNRLHIPLPKDANYAAMMAISYYIIGKIQSQQPAWFKRNIKSYANKVSKQFGYTISPIVE